MKARMVSALRVDHVFAEAMKIGLARRAGIGHRRNPCRAAGLGRPDRDIGAAVPDMHMKVRPTGRQIGAVTIDGLGIGEGRRRDPTAIIDVDFVGGSVEADCAKIDQT